MVMEMRIQMDVDVVEEDDFCYYLVNGFVKYICENALQNHLLVEKK